MGKTFYQYHKAFSSKAAFGCRSSPFIFNQVAEALCWILLNRVRVPSLLHLLDDFLLIDPPRIKSGFSLPKLRSLFSHLGVPLSVEKTIGPATRLEFLGVTLDTIEMKASLPVEKTRAHLRSNAVFYLGQTSNGKANALSPRPPKFCYAHRSPGSLIHIQAAASGFVCA